MTTAGTPDSESDYLAKNRETWDRYAADYVAPGRREWGLELPTWGIFGVPESELHMLPDDLAGQDTIELGCGTGYVSAWMARRSPRRRRPVMTSSSGRVGTRTTLRMPISHPPGGRRWRDRHAVP